MGRLIRSNAIQRCDSSIARTFNLSCEQDGTWQTSAGMCHVAGTWRNKKKTRDALIPMPVLVIDTDTNISNGYQYWYSTEHDVLKKQQLGIDVPIPIPVLGIGADTNISNGCRYG